MKEPLNFFAVFPQNTITSNALVLTIIKTTIRSDGQKHFEIKYL